MRSNTLHNTDEYNLMSKLQKKFYFYLNGFKTFIFDKYQSIKKLKSKLKVFNFHIVYTKKILCY